MNIKIKLTIILLLIAILSLYLLPGKSTIQAEEDDDGSSEVSILIKYKKEELKEKKENKQGKEATQEIKKIVKNRGDIEDVVKIQSETTKKQVELNRKKFPQRAKRAPKNAIIPDLLLQKRIKAKKEDAEKLLEELKKDPEIEYAIIEKEPKPATVPDDPYYSVWGVPHMI